MNAPDQSQVIGRRNLANRAAYLMIVEWKQTSYKRRIRVVNFRLKSSDYCYTRHQLLNLSLSCESSRVGNGALPSHSPTIALEARGLTSASQSFLIGGYALLLASCQRQPSGEPTAPGRASLQLLLPNNPTSTPIHDTPTHRPYTRVAFLRRATQRQRLRLPRSDDV